MALIHFKQISNSIYLNFTKNNTFNRSSIKNIMKQKTSNFRSDKSSIFYS